MFVYLTNDFKEKKEELKKYAGKLIAKSKDNTLEIYERNDIVPADNKNICVHCGSVSNHFKQDFRDITQGNPEAEASGLTKYHSCPGCFALTDEKFWSKDLKKERQRP